ncbi:MAG TPA: O-methyltransferase [Chloroflexota bacterium]|nr:O-methyltransferase [Chloroflexota bacterium]
MATSAQPDIALYIRDLFLAPDDVLDATLVRAKEAELPTIQVPPEVGRLLTILAHAAKARRILEIGALGGYSGIHLARALPREGRLISLEASPLHAKVARENLAGAELEDRAEVRLGRALDLLPALASEEPFDFAFIDADKPSYPAYLEWCLRLVRPGGLIVADNALFHGRVADPANRDEGVRAIDAMNRAAAANPLLDAIIVPNRDGQDGLLIAVVRERPE